MNIDASKAELLEALEDCIAQGCQMPDGTLNDGCLSAYENGLDLLDRLGRVEKTEQYGRYQWAKEARS